MSNPLVSIIIPLYNGEQFLSQCIESALSQSYQNFELIIINDGSTDNSHRIINKYLLDPRVHYFEQKNSGVATARNVAIEKSKGEFISFLDQDDLWHPDKLKIQIDTLQKHKDISILYSDYIILNTLENSNNRISDIASFDLSQCDLRSIFIRNRIGVLTALVNKQCLIKSGLLDTQLKGTDDYELWLRLALDYKFHYIPIPLATYRWHGNNASNNDILMMIEEAKAICSFLEKRPDAYDVLGKDIIKNRLFNIYSKIGNLYSWRYKDRINARYYFLLALKQDPLHFEIITKYFNSFFTPKFARFISWQWRKFKKL